MSKKQYSWDDISVNTSGKCDGFVNYEIVMRCDLETKNKFEKWVAGLAVETTRLDALETAALSAINSTVKELSIGLEELNDTVRNMDDGMDEEIVQAHNQTMQLTRRYDKRLDLIETDIEVISTMLDHISKAFNQLVQSRRTIEDF